MQSPLIEVGNSLRVIGQALDDYFNNLPEDAGPLDGSQAAEESKTGIGASEKAGTLFTAGWVFTTRGIPSDHLQVASRLITRDGERASVHRFAVLSLVRVTLEVSALAWWLSRPHVGARGRMQQTLLHERWSFDQVERAEKLLASPDPTETLAQKMRDEMQSRIDALAQEHNLQKILSGSRDIPKASHLIGKEFDAVKSGLGRQAQNMYARLSEVTHGNMLGTVSGYLPPSESDEPAGPGVPLWLLCLGAQYAAFGFSHAVTTYLEFMGWDAKGWGRASSQALLTLEAVASDVNQAAGSSQNPARDEILKPVSDTGNALPISCDVRRGRQAGARGRADSAPGCVERIRLA